MNTTPVWKCARNTIVLGLCWSLGWLPSYAQSEGAIVTQRGAVVRGAVVGNVMALDEAATLKVDPGAEVAGDLVMPAERNSRPVSPPGKPDSPKKLKLSPAATIAITAGAEVKGQQRIANGFVLPRPPKQKIPHGNRAVVIESGCEPDPDFSVLRDLILRNVPHGMQLPPRSVSMPAGDYGRIVVDQGQLLLGVVGATARIRYSFDQLSVGPEGSVELLSPVVLTVGRLGTIAGRMGNRRFTQWLDLRVAEGEVVLAEGSEVHGVITSPESFVKLHRGAALRGGAVCDQALVESEARFTGVQPSWSREATGNAAPLFIHRAVRVNQQLAEFSFAWANLYQANVSYPDDLPVLVITPGAAKITTDQEQQAFFDACNALLSTSGFQQAKLTLGRGRFPLEVLLTHESYEDAVLSVSQADAISKGIPIIRDDPNKLTAFMKLLISPAATPTLQPLPL